MKQTLLALSAKFAIATSIVGLIGSSAYAGLITGDISFAGAYSPNLNNLINATQINFQNTFVVSATDDFSSVAPLTGVTMASSLTFNPLFSVGNNPLWSVGGFSFTLSSLAIENQTATALTLSGVGKISKSGFDDTDGSWVATFNSNGMSRKGTATFSWSSTSVADNVPDGGSSLLLLGVAVTGCGIMLRRRQSVTTG
ncbi:hypothetical protein GC207_12835 [bacterium]|nr:hypothetical protein [bacterium]